LNTTFLGSRSLSEELKSTMIRIEGIYGMYSFPSGIYLVLICKSERIYNHGDLLDLRMIRSMEIVKLACKNLTLSIEERRKEQKELVLLRNTLKEHKLYYLKSKMTDVTNTLQRSFTNNETDERFYWNDRLLEPIKKSTNFSVLEPFLHICTSAYVGLQKNIPLCDNVNYTQLLISRRSKERAGTRFTRRGSDLEGNVANFVETEQIIFVNNEVYSHVQIRGSIPLIWSSPANLKNYNPRVSIELNPIAQARSLRLHLLNLHKFYGKNVLFINLIDKKKDQGRLGRALHEVLDAVLEIFSNSSKTTTHAIWFDFHAECLKKGKHLNLLKLLKEIQPRLQYQNFFHMNLNSYKIESKQNGVIRTNCMDCLDRTNVVQTIIARWILFLQLQSKMPLEYIPAFKRRNPLGLSWHQGELFHRLIWADNADHISSLYAGTNALKGDYTRYGKRTTKGQIDDGLSSLTRYYKNNFQDAQRQLGIDFMIGERSIKSTKHDHFQKRLQYRPWWIHNDYSYDNYLLQESIMLQIILILLAILL